MTYQTENDSLPSFQIFDQIPEIFLKKDLIASAIQSFEIALFLASLGYWHSVIPSVWESCERLLRVNCPPKDIKGKVTKIRDARTSHQVQMEYKKIFDVSDALDQRVDDLRRARNKIAHRGYTVCDLNGHIDLLFNAAVPYMQSLMENLFGVKFYELSSHSLYWSIYGDTHRVVNRTLQTKPEADNLWLELYFFRQISRNVWSFKYGEIGFESYSARKYLLDNCFEGDIQDIEAAIRNLYISKVTQLPRTRCVELKDYNCCICGSDEVLAGITSSSDPIHGGFIFDLTVIACTQCTYQIEDLGMIEVFCKEKLSELEMLSLRTGESKDAKPNRLFFDLPNDIEEYLL